MEFLINVLRINERKPLPPEMLKELRDDARYIRRADVWLFEGDWELCFLPFIEDGVKIKSFGQIPLETISSDASDEELFEQIRYLLPKAK